MAAKKIGISRDLIIHPGETIADVLEEVLNILRQVKDLIFPHWNFLGCRRSC